MTANAMQALACQQSAATALDSARCLLAAFDRLGVPDSMLDVGCGNGHLVRIAGALGVSAAGMDIALPKHESRNGYVLVRADLSIPFVEMTPRDLVLCLEVAEHLPPESAETLCDTLVGAVALGGTLLFSAATPGQGGAGHLNEQPHDYWRALLTARGLVEDGTLTADLRREWTVAAPRAWWYPKNLIVFRRTA